MTTILVLYYSVHGGTRALADHIAQGIESEGSTALLRTVPRVSVDYDPSATSVPESGAPYVTQKEFAECDGLLLGSPTRFGNMAAPLKYFLDSTSDSWLKGSLTGKPGGVFTSSSSMHGGQESTLLSMMLPLLHHGMILSGIPYSEPALHETQTGGSPYGATHVSQSQNNLSHHEQRIAYVQGKRIAQLSQKLMQKA